MPRKYFVLAFLVLLLFFSCNELSFNSTERQDSDTSSFSIPNIDSVDSSFNDFIDKYSSDENFARSRTKFPLKIIFYDIDNDKDTVIYAYLSDYKELDFRKKKSSGQQDQWEQFVSVNHKDNSATITIQGIDNGILVVYRFEKIEGHWVLVEIDDSST
jgi:hypothetical protein